MDSVESRLHGTLLGLREQVLEFGSMRTIEIDESLMRKAMRVSGTDQAGDGGGCVAVADSNEGAGWNAGVAGKGRLAG